MRGQQNQTAIVAESLQARRERRARGLIETREGFVEQQQSRVMQQRALEREALAHAA